MEKVYKTPVIFGCATYRGNKMAVCCVDEKGKTRLVSKKIKMPIVKHNYFFIRGIEFLIFGLWQFLSNLLQTQFQSSKVSYKMSNALNVSIKQITTFVISLISIFIGIILSPRIVFIF